VRQWTGRTRTTRELPVPSSLAGAPARERAAHGLSNVTQGQSGSLRDVRPTVRCVPPHLHDGRSNVRGVRPSLHGARLSMYGVRPTVRDAQPSLQGAGPSLRDVRRAEHGAFPRWDTGKRRRKGRLPRRPGATYPLAHLSTRCSGAAGLSSAGNPASYDRLWGS